MYYINPLTPKISSVILLTVCHTVLVMLVLRIWYCRSTNNPLIDIFSIILITCLLDIVLISKGEILSWSLMGVKGLKILKRFHIITDLF